MYKPCEDFLLNQNLSIIIIYSKIVLIKHSCIQKNINTHQNVSGQTDAIFAIIIPQSDST